MTVRSIVVGDLGTITNGLEKRLEKLVIYGRIVTVQATKMILRSVLETLTDLLYNIQLKLVRKTSKE